LQRFALFNLLFCKGGKGRKSKLLFRILVKGAEAPFLQEQGNTKKSITEGDRERVS